MRGSVLSQRYAEALADVVEKHGELERVRDELNALADAMARDRTMQKLMATAALSREQKKAFLRRISTELGLSPRTHRLLDYLAEQKRAAMLPDLAESFADEADRRLGIRRAVVTSAVPLDEAQRGLLVARLQAATGSRIELEEVIDESLIAGFQIHTDGRFFDGSLRGKLERIRETIAHG